MKTLSSYNYLNYKEPPKVSVIVPFYQVEDYIEQCSRSLFLQTYPNIEFVFVNDGSTDCSLEILEKTIKDYPLLHSRIHIIGHSHLGVPMIKIRGLESASGDYVIFVDSDDWVDPSFIDHLVKVALTEDADVVYCDCVKEYPNKPHKIVEEGDFYPDDGPHASDAIFEDHIRAYMWNKLIKRELYSIDRIVIPPCAYQEDIAILAQVLFQTKKCFHLKEALYHYRRRRAGALTSDRHRSKLPQAAENMLVLYESLPVDSELKLSLGSKMLLKAGWNSLIMRRPDVLLNHPAALKQLALQPFIPTREYRRIKQGALKLFCKILMHVKISPRNRPYRIYAAERDSDVLSILSELRANINNNNLRIDLKSVKEKIVAAYYRETMDNLAIPTEDATMIHEIMASYFFQSLPAGDEDAIPTIDSKWKASFEEVIWIARALANRNRPVNSFQYK